MPARLAAEAAALVDPARHALIRAPEDAFRPEYQEIAGTLRSVRDSSSSGTGT